VKKSRTVFDIGGELGAILFRKKEEQSPCLGGGGISKTLLEKAAGKNKTGWEGTARACTKKGGVNHREKKPKKNTTEYGEPGGKEGVRKAGEKMGDRRSQLWDRVQAQTDQIRKENGVGAEAAPAVRPSE